MQCSLIAYGGLMKDVERVAEIGRVELIERKEVLGNGESDIEMTDCGVWEE